MYKLLIAGYDRFVATSHNFLSITKGTYNSSSNIGKKMDRIKFNKYYF